MPPTAASEAYNQLISHLHPTTPRVLEIDILPSSHGSQIQFSKTDAALGIPKPVLVQCFLQARNRYFAAPLAQIDETRWHATSLILLLDPNHTTAINFRKRYLLAHSPTLPSRPKLSYADKAIGNLVEHELHFLESLLTSPMRKHNKSPTLFTHRLWILRTFIMPFFSQDITPSRGVKSSTWKIWERELNIVMLAGGKHLANYYAWNYARDVLVLLESFMDGCSQQMDMAESSLEMIKQWCFQHPRDVSGWTFLVWLIERVSGSSSRLGIVRGLLVDVDKWKCTMQWEGAAVDAFVKLTRIVDKV